MSTFTCIYSYTQIHVYIIYNIYILYVHTFPYIIQWHTYINWHMQWLDLVQRLPTRNSWAGIKSVSSTWNRIFRLFGWKYPTKSSVCSCAVPAIVYTKYVSLKRGQKCVKSTVILIRANYSIYMQVHCI